MSKAKQYKQKFRKEWLQKEVFGKWLSEVSADMSKAHCKLCNCDIVAKHTDLVNHMKSKKHTHASQSPLKAVQLTDFFQKKCNKTAQLEISKKYYIQRFRVEWLNDSKYKNWLCTVNGDSTKCLCKYCKCTLIAKISDIEKHRNTNKHKKAENLHSAQQQSVVLIKEQETEEFNDSHSSKHAEGNLVKLIYVYDNSENNHFKESSMEFSSVINVLKNFAPLNFAESWDNVGVLVEPPDMGPVKKLLLTNDLTLAVMDEAEEKQVDMILSYHPPIFKPLKAVTASHWKERIVGRCIARKIAVYSPHTSYDALKGGVNDWLIGAFGVGKVTPVQRSFREGDWTHRMEVAQPPDSNISIYQLISEHFKDKATIICGGENTTTTLLCRGDLITDIVSFLTESEIQAQFAVSKFENVPLLDYGMGRKMILDIPITLKEAIEKTKEYIGLSRLRVAVKHGETEDHLIRSVAVCAGSGISVLRSVYADLFLTGEMSHHDVLEMTQKGSSVILTEHSNSERGFLSAVLQPKLTVALQSNVDIIVSSADTDPLKIM